MKGYDMKVKLLALITTVALSAMLFAVASSATGAYFSDAKAGTVAGQGGVVKVATSEMNISFAKMFPGEVNAVSVDYRNDGDAAQDVWVVFNNETALSALNSAGTYGAARVTSTNGAYFYSNNLNDHPIDQGDVCKMLPKMIKLASGLAPSGSGTMKFEYQVASKLGSAVFNADGSVKYPASAGTGSAFNKFPVSTPGSLRNANYDTVGSRLGDGNLADYDQRYVTAGQSGTGLPYQIVATQVGVEPGNAGTVAGF